LHKEETHFNTTISITNFTQILTACAISIACLLRQFEEMSNSEMKLNLITLLPLELGYYLAFFFMSDDAA
jgi:hypothetical protein